jgi:hypothetical protein
METPRLTLIFELANGTFQSAEIIAYLCNAVTISAFKFIRSDILEGLGRLEQLCYDRYEPGMNEYVSPHCDNPVRT